MNRIQKVSTFFLTILKTLVVILPGFIILNWIILGTALRNSPYYTFVDQLFQSPEEAVMLSAVAWTPLAQAVGIAASMLESLPVFLSLFVLISIFKNYQRGDIFSIANATYYKLLGWLFFLDALIAQPLGDMLMSLAVTLPNPPGHRYISLGFGTPNIEALFCGAVLIMISWVMLEAARLHDEQKFTV